MLILTRTTRSVMPTEAGRALAERLAPLLAAARAALQDVTGPDQEVRGRLKLNVTGAVMVDILPPLIDRFLLRHPTVRIEIMVDDRLVDITAAGCDAGVRYGEHLAQDMIAVRCGGGHRARLRRARHRLHLPQPARRRSGNRQAATGAAGLVASLRRPAAVLPQPAHDGAATRLRRYAGARAPGRLS